MAEQKVSYRYAKAIFESAVSENLEEQIFNDFLIIDQILNFVPELKGIAKKPLLSQVKKKKLYKEIFSDKVSKETLNFLLFLVDKNRDYLIRDIVLQYKRLFYSLKNILPVEIYFAKDFEDELKIKIIKRLEENTGKKVLPSFIIDKDIIGGFKIKIEDWVFDATIRNKLDSLYQELVATVKIN